MIDETGVSADDFTYVLLSAVNIMLMQVSEFSPWTIYHLVVLLTAQAGFAMLECGMVKRNNVSNILLKNLADTNIVAVVTSSSNPRIHD